MRILLITIVFLTFSIFAPVNAFSDEASQKLAQQTIKNQIEAFKAGDDTKAYSFASPRVTQFFPDVMSFMDMVKGGYQPVYKPRNYDFGRARDVAADQIMQEVFVTGPDGKPWTAIYGMVKLADGNWLIDSVQIVPGDDSSA